MTDTAPLYSPNPPNVPKDLTEPNWSYCTRVLLVLAGLILFMALYVGLVAGPRMFAYGHFRA